MTPKEELMQAVQTLPEDMIQLLLSTLKRPQRGPEKATRTAGENSDVKKPEQMSERLREKNGFLVAETGKLDGFDTTAFLKGMREDRIQSQLDQIGL